MKIQGWEKISGFTYKGYSIVNPMHNASEDIYYATVLNLNHVYKPKWDITLSINDITGVINFRINDNTTQHLLAKSHLTKTNIDTLQKFREQYEMLVDDILENGIASKVTRNINGGTTGIIGRVMNTGTPVTYSIAPQSAGVNVLYGSSSLSTTFTPAHLLQTIKDLQEQIDKLNSK
jgi:hypothetical protein